MILRRACWLRERQSDPKFRAPAWSRVNRDGSTMHIDGPFRDCQAQSSSTTVARPRLVEPEESVKDALTMLGGDTGAIVSDRQQRLIADSGHVDAHR